MVNLKKGELKQLVGGLHRQFSYLSQAVNHALNFAKIPMGHTQSPMIACVPVLRMHLNLNSSHFQQLSSHFPHRENYNEYSPFYLLAH